MRASQLMAVRLAEGLAPRTAALPPLGLALRRAVSLGASAAVVPVSPPSSGSRRGALAVPCARCGSSAAGPDAAGHDAAVAIARGTADAGPASCGSRCAGAATAAVSDSRWGAFCEHWNESLARRPSAMVVFFSGATTLTWAMTFVALSSLPSARLALGAPEIAVGWLVMRMTARLRMPLNFAVAAPLSRLLPALSRLKISPLLAVFAADAEAKKRFDEAKDKFIGSLRSERMQRVVQNSFKASEKFVRWAEGPIDKFGLSYFVTSKVSNVSTLIGGTLAAMHGLDVSGQLSAWGLSADLQADSGLLAGTAALNVGFAPLHFVGAVAAVASVERLGSRLWLDRQAELREKRLHAPEVPLSTEEQEHLDMPESQMVSVVVAAAVILTLVFDLAFALYMVRRLHGSQQKGDGSPGAEVRAQALAMLCNWIAWLFKPVGI